MATPRLQSMRSIVRSRLEPFVVIIISGFVVLFLNLILQHNALWSSQSAYLYSVGWIFLIVLASAIIFEFLFAIVRFVGAIFVRGGHVWSLSVPALTVFFLLIEPLLSLTVSPQETAVSWFEAVMLQMSLLSFTEWSIVIVAAISVFAIIVTLPVFYGLNSSFLLAATIVSRLLLLPVQSLLFSNPASFSILQFLGFVAVVVGFSILFYFYFQIRRRVGLSPFYERFKISNLAIVLTLIMIVSCCIALLVLAQATSNYRIQMIITYVTVIAAVLIMLLLYLLILKYEAKTNRSIRIRYSHAFIVLVLLIASGITALIRNYEAAYIFFARPAIAGNLFEQLSLLTDTDHDGNSRWPGKDPDDTNAAIRIEASADVSADLSEIEPIGYTMLNHTLLTFVIDGDLIENPIYSNDTSKTHSAIIVRPPQSEAADSIGLQSALQTSNQPERTLRSWFQGLTSLEEINETTRRSLLSIAAEDGYRTLCFGNDDGSGYFSHQHRSKLDAGCQVFETIETTGDTTTTTNDFQSCLSDSITKANSLASQYAEKHTFLWLHIDTRRCNDKSNMQSADQKRDAIASLIQLIQSPASPYHSISGFSHKYLSLILETGYLPRYSIATYDTTRQSHTSALVFSPSLSSHLLLFRWYFTELFEAHKDHDHPSLSALRKAEKLHQAGAATDLNNWIFLHSANQADKVDILSIGKSSNRLPSSILYYDSRQRQLRYSHGIWNRTVFFDDAIRRSIQSNTDE